MVQIFLENSASGLGLSRLQIALAVGWAVLCLVLLVAFILITLSAWRNEGGFEVVVQSLLRVRQHGDGAVGAADQHGVHG